MIKIGSVTIGQEDFYYAMADCQELIKENWNEIALHKDKIPLRVDWFRYEMMYRNGDVDVIAARDNGVLIGYNSIFYTHPIHYSSSTVANNDVIYLSKEYRNAKIGEALIDVTEEVWMKRADMCVYHTKPEHPMLRMLLESRGYMVSEISLHKVKR